jgi:hypothetical protein
MPWYLADDPLALMDSPDGKGAADSRQFVPVMPGHELVWLL